MIQVCQARERGYSVARQVFVVKHIYQVLSSEHLYKVGYARSLHKPRFIPRKSASATPNPEERLPRADDGMRLVCKQRKTRLSRFRNRMIAS